MRSGRLQSVHHRPDPRGGPRWLAGGMAGIAARKRAYEDAAHLEAALESTLKFVISKPGAGEAAFYGIGDALGPAIEHAASFFAQTGVTGLRFVHFQDMAEPRAFRGGEVEIEACAGPLSSERIFETCRRLDLPRAAIVLLDPGQLHAVEATASLIGTATDEGSIVILSSNIESGVENDAVTPKLLPGNGWGADVLLRFGREREGRVLALRPSTPHLDAVRPRALVTPP